MSQYSTGTAAVVNGSATVVAGGTADWTGITTNDRFGVSGDDKVYGLVAAATTTLTLETPYQGVTSSIALYSITRDFTTNLQLPLIYGGDLNTRPLLRRLAEILDLIWGPGGGGGGGSSLAAYLLVGENDPNLINSRRLLTTPGLLPTDSGPGSSLTIEVDWAVVGEAQGGLDVPKVMNPYMVAQAITALAGGAGGGAPANAPYVVWGTSPSTLTGKRQLASTAAFTFVDNGAFNTLILTAVYPTQAEAALGTDNVKLMTAQRTAQAITAKLVSTDAGNDLTAPAKEWVGTQAAYDALVTKDAGTLYYIKA